VGRDSARRCATQGGRITDDDIAQAKARAIKDVAFTAKPKQVGKYLVGPCPICGGDDRFNTKGKVWFCRICAQGGDVIELVMAIERCGFADAVRKLASGSTSYHKNSTAAQAQRQDDDAEDEDAARAALRIWDEARPIEGTIAWPYLTRPRAEGGRGLVIPAGLSGRVLRFHPTHWWRPDGSGDPVQVPALLALFRDIRTDEPRAIWRRRLTPDGRSAGKPRTRGPSAGCVIKLTADDDVTEGLHVGEGVETVLAAMMRGFAPAWACGGTGNLSAFPVLPGIDALTIIVDHDADGAGQKAASTCYDRWYAAGREVWSVVPDEPGDFNDVPPGGAS
jgi:hypothetical protein